MALATLMFEDLVMLPVLSNDPLGMGSVLGQPIVQWKHLVDELVGFLVATLFHHQSDPVIKGTELVNLRRVCDTDPS